VLLASPILLLILHSGLVRPVWSGYWRTNATKWKRGYGEETGRVASIAGPQADRPDPCLADLDRCPSKGPRNLCFVWQCEQQYRLDNPSARPTRAACAEESACLVLLFVPRPTPPGLARLGEAAPAFQHASPCDACVPSLPRSPTWVRVMDARQRSTPPTSHAPSASTAPRCHRLRTCRPASGSRCRGPLNSQPGDKRPRIPRPACLIKVSAG